MVRNKHKVFRNLAKYYRKKNSPYGDELKDEKDKFENILKKTFNKKTKKQVDKKSKVKKNKVKKKKTSKKLKNIQKILS